MGRLSKSMQLACCVLSSGGCLSSLSRSGLGASFCYCPCNVGKGCFPCFFPCTDPRTVPACPCPSPRGWYRACQGGSIGCHPAISAGAWMWCSARGFAWVVRPVRGGGLGESRMRMTSASASLPSLRRATFVSLCRLRGYLKVVIGIFSLVCAFGVFCVALGADAGFSPGHCCAALVCCILCVYWDSIPRAC